MLVVVDIDITCFVDVEIQRYSRSGGAREVCSSYSVLRQLRERKGRRTIDAPQNQLNNRREKAKIKNKK